jgi:DNA-binding transcriptional LysR family regulator
MELRVLRYFLTVAREGSMTAAADFLHVTQPTLSRQIKDLEQELEKKLFIQYHSHR